MGWEGTRHLSYSNGKVSRVRSILSNENETFLGGFMSGFLARGLRRIGYGLYFTNQRLFGVDPGRNGGSVLASTLAGLVEGQLMPHLSQDENTRVIGELDRVKDFQFVKSQIQSLELKKPGMLGTGHFVVHNTNGDSIKVDLRHRTAYDRLTQLLQAFRAGPLDTQER